jgi:hypothetical protein
MNGRTVFLSLLLVTVAVCQTRAAEQNILDMGAKDWKYLDTADGPEEEWHKADFDDSQWKSGQAPLGYGDDDIKQTIAFGDDEGSKNICAFFRRTVEVDDPQTAKKVVGKLICDDGCVIYVNGEEVHRFNLPAGELKQDTIAVFTVGGEIERHEFTFLVDAAKFKPGKNAIAVRVHQRGAESSDLAFNLSLTGLDDDEAIENAKQTHDLEQEQIKLAIEQGF